MAADDGGAPFFDALGYQAGDVVTILKERVLRDFVAEAHFLTHGVCQGFDGLATPQARTRYEFLRFPRGDGENDVLRLTASAVRKRPRLVLTHKCRRVQGFSVTQHNQCERVEATLNRERLEVVENHPVRIVGKSLTCLLNGEPLEAVHLVVGHEGRPLHGLVRHLGCPVVHDLVLATGHGVFRHTGGDAQRNRKTRFFGDLAHAGLGQKLAGVNLALGKRVILALRAVNHEDENLVALPAPAHRTGGINDVGVELGHEATPFRRCAIPSITASCTFIRSWPSLSTWWRIHSPEDSRCHVIDLSDMPSAKRPLR